MTKKKASLLVDTSVWLDYFLGRKGAQSAAKFLGKSLENDDVIVTSTSITKDVFYLIGASLKRRAIADGKADFESNAKAVNEIAWQCLSTIQGMAVVLNQGFEQHLEAMVLRDANSDYEDDLLVATAQSADIDFIVTSDDRLLKSSPIPAITAEEYCASH